MQIKLLEHKGVGVYNLLVLGLVPGTNIQITFQSWLYILGVMLFVYMAYSVSKMFLRQQLMAKSVTPQPSQTMSASQLDSISI